MRDLEFFEDVREYEAHIWDSVFTESWVQETPFYRNLVNFVMDNHAPIFYTVSDKREHFAFSGAYYFETRRQRYPNRAREQLFWLHDFTHMLFPYAHDVYDTTEREFLNQFWYQERIASSETEIMSYYRAPGLRDLVFPDEKLWYDVIQEEGWINPNDNFWIDGFKKPDPELFLKYRIKTQMDDEFGEKVLGGFPEILKFVQQWRHLTPNWISKRYASVAGRRIEGPVRDKNFHASNYERRISEYTEEARPTPEQREAQYRMHIMENVRMAYDLAEMPGKPEKWRHMPEAIDRLEGAVLLT